MAEASSCWKLPSPSGTGLRRAVEQLQQQPPQRSQVVRVRAAVAEPQKLVEEATGAFPRGAHWQVHKFGGTCVATSDRILESAKAMLAAGDQRMVVVSAMGSHPSSPVKVTTGLLLLLLGFRGRFLSGP